MSKKIIIIAGPNGAGKTTFARSFLPEEAQCPRFINADLIAAGLSPFAPEAAALKAGRLMLEEIAECVRKGESFAFETTLAGPGVSGAHSGMAGAGLPCKPVFPEPAECGDGQRTGAGAGATGRA